MSAGQNIPEEPGIRITDIREAFSIFIYPFFFPQNTYRLVLENVLNEPAWLLEAAVAPLDEGEQRHLRYFYPYVQKFLFPAASLKGEELSFFPPEKLFFKGEGVRENGAAWRLGKRASVEKQLALLSLWQVVRWRWNFARSPRVPQEFYFYGRPARFEKVSLLLFPTGVGLLLLEAAPGGGKGKGEGESRGEQLDLARLKEFNKKFAVLEEMPFGGLGPAEIETGPEAKAQKKKLGDVIREDYLSFLPAALREEGSYSLGEAKLFHYCFLCVDLEKGGGLREILERFADNPEVFPSVVGFRGVNTLGWFTKSGAAVVAGAPAGAGGPDPEHLRRYWRTIYFDIFLHALYHRLSLLKFSWELSKIDELVSNAREVGQLRWRFLQFTNKAWFGHLTNAEYGNFIWRRWKEVMETEQLYEEVRTQLRELDEYLEHRQREHNENLIRMLTAIGIPVSFVLGFFSTSFIVVEGLQMSLGQAVLVALAALGILFGICAGCYKVSLRRESRRAGQAAARAAKGAAPAAGAGRLSRLRPFRRCQGSERSNSGGGAAFGGER